MISLIIFIAGWLFVGYTTAGAVYNFFEHNFPGMSSRFEILSRGIVVTLCGIGSAIGVAFAGGWKYGVEWRWPLA
jgi:hypothetical protein